MAIGKRLRFEVFKRDKFTCQYCGKKAPDVVLHADHIEPKSKGGADDLLNLITACSDCNLGKGAKRLSDDSAVVKQRDQLADLQERQEQIAMMMEWQRSLVDLDAQELDEAVDFWCDLMGKFSLTDVGKANIRKLLRAFGLQEVLEAMRVAAESYLKLDDNSEPTFESAEVALGKIGGICRIRRAEKDKPYLKDVFYIRGILKNRLSYVNYAEAKSLLEELFEEGADAEELKKVAREVRNWTQWRSEMVDYLAWLRSPADEGGA